MRYAITNGDGYVYASPAAALDRLPGKNNPSVLANMEDEQLVEHGIFRLVKASQPNEFYEASTELVRVGNQVHEQVNVSLKPADQVFQIAQGMKKAFMQNLESKAESRRLSIIGVAGVGKTMEYLIKQEEALKILQGERDESILPFARHRKATKKVELVDVAEEWSQKAAAWCEEGAKITDVVDKVSDAVTALADDETIIEQLVNVTALEDQLWAGLNSD